MYIVARFTSSYIPQSGLTPTIIIYRIVDNTQMVSTTMTEVTHGSYKYDFANMAKKEDYHIHIDGGSSLSNFDRYKYRFISREFDGTVVYID